jgi:hypothetical protein
MRRSTMNSTTKKKKVVAGASNKITTKLKTISIVKEDLNMTQTCNSNKELNQKTELQEIICQGPQDKPQMKRRTLTNNSLGLNNKCRPKTFKNLDIPLIKIKIMVQPAFVKDA